MLEYLLAAHHKCRLLVAAELLFPDLLGKHQEPVGLLLGNGLLVSTNEQ